MKSRKLNEAFSYIDDKYLDLALSEMHKKKRTWLRYGAIAACLCLIFLFPVGAVAGNWFGLRNLLLPDSSTEEPQKSEEQNNEVQSSEETEIEEAKADRISLAGYIDSPEMQAQMEWQAFLDGYDTDGAIISEIGNSSLDLDSRYSLYYVYTQEMGDTLDEIVQKYHLKLHTDIDSISPQELVYRLGKDFMTENCTKYWSYIYEDGSFAFDGDMTLDNGEVISYQFKRVVKGTFDEVILNIGDAADYKECPYMTAGGEEVMLAFGADKSLIYVDFEDCFITINVLCGNENGMTEENLKQLAEAVDFTMLKEVRAPEMRGDSE